MRQSFFWLCRIFERIERIIVLSMQPKPNAHSFLTPYLCPTTHFLSYIIIPMHICLVHRIIHIHTWSHFTNSINGHISIYGISENQSTGNRKWISRENCVGRMGKAGQQMFRNGIRLRGMRKTFRTFHPFPIRFSHFCCIDDDGLPLIRHSV